MCVYLSVHMGWEEMWGTPYTNSLEKNRNKYSNVCFQQTCTAKKASFRHLWHASNSIWYVHSYVQRGWSRCATGSIHTKSKSPIWCIHTCNMAHTYTSHCSSCATVQYTKCIGGHIRTPRSLKYEENVRTASQHAWCLMLTCSQFSGQTVPPAAEAARTAHSVVVKVLFEGVSPTGNWGEASFRHLWHASIRMNMCIHMCDMAHADVRHESFVINHIFYLTCPYVQHSCVHHYSFRRCALMADIHRFTTGILK